MIKKYQPNALINSRIGNSYGDYRSCADNQVDFAKGSNEEGTEYSKAVGARTGLIEVPATLNDTWGFKYFDNNWKSAEKIIETKERLNSQDVNYLLNVGPDHLGRIPAPSVDILREVGKRNIINTK